jgi:DNA polymerase-3 subunit beta
MKVGKDRQPTNDNQKKQRSKEMKLRIKTNDLRVWMGRLLKLSHSRNSLPILDTVRLEADEEGRLSLDFTNGDAWMKAEIPAEVSFGGGCLVNAKKLLESSKLMQDSEISMDLSPRGLKVSGRSATYTFATMATSEFPSEPAMVGEAGALKVEVAGRFLEGMIKGVEESISTYESCYLLRSLKMEVEESVVRMVTTDGRRLSLYERDLQELGTSVLSPGEEGEALIPVDAVKVIRDLSADANAETIKILADAKSLDFWWNAAWLRVKLVEGKFPNYRACIPDFSSRTAVPIAPDEWSEAISSVLAIAVTTGKDKTPKLVISKDSFQLEEPEVGSARVELASDVAEEVTVNAQFLLEAVQSIPTAKAVFYPGSSTDPVLLTLQDHSPKNPIRWTHVLMPMRTLGGAK